MQQNNVVARYRSEIDKLKDKLSQLKDKRVYEITNCKADGFLQTNAEQLEKMIFDLLYKITTDKPSDMEVFTMELVEAMGNTKEESSEK